MRAAQSAVQLLVHFSLTDCVEMNIDLAGGVIRGLERERPFHVSRPFAWLQRVLQTGELRQRIYVYPSLVSLCCRAAAVLPFEVTSG